ncbi:MAG: aminotransferase class I/II-fold pyridoxal phosphate-dependent enzyme [Oligoflexia bacterium]|nr:aminotransferase class I/II-fold pyridoxal phosphate-dependent enzyme [Oligoflexia bacterium]
MKNLRLNTSITNLKESATLAINLKAKGDRKKGENVAHFGFGQSPFPVPQIIQEELKKNTHQKAYLPTKGLPELCKQIAKYYKDNYGFSLNEESILISPGSKELIFQVLYVLEGPVIVPAPSWVSYGPQLNIRGKDLVRVITKRDNNYKITAQQLKESSKDLEDDQKLLILNNPSNPTGALYSREELVEIGKVCEEENIIIISDEIYSLVNFTEQKYTSLFEICPDRTIVTGGLSKSHGAGGYRLGFIALPEKMESLLKALCSMISETYSAVSAPIQFAALGAYQNNEELDKYVADCERVHKAAGNYLHRRFTSMGLNCPKPEGAFYLFPDFEDYKDKLKAKGITTSAQLCDYIYDNYKVAMLPGSDFYMDEDYLGCRVASVDYEGETVLENITDAQVDDAFLEKYCPQLKYGCDQLEQFLSTL